ncbi:hypothetical protein V8C40DRAFT_246485 [Trichoderma camerunense]
MQVAPSLTASSPSLVARDQEERLALVSSTPLFISCSKGTEDPTLPRDGRPDEIGNASSSDDSIAPPLIPAHSDPGTL